MFFTDCISTQGPLRFTNCPFDGMQTISAISDMRNSNIFASRQNTGKFFRYQTIERNLKWSGSLSGARY